MKRYLYDCGHCHIEQHRRCPLCKIGKYVEDVYSVKLNRFAIDVIKGKVIKSRFDLPGFIYLPQYKYDIYNTNVVLDKLTKSYFDWRVYVKTGEIKKF